MKTKITLSLGMAAVLTISGCATTDEQQTRTEGVAAGALIGGLVGLVLGDSKKVAVAGALVGAIAGDIYAKSVVRKKEDYADAESYMNDVIKDAETNLARSQLERKSLLANFDEYTAEIVRIKKKQDGTESGNLAFKKQIRLAQKDLKAADELIAHLNEEIDMQNQILERERKVIPVSLVQHFESTISSYESEKRQLELLKSKIANLDRRKLY